LLIDVHDVALGHMTRRGGTSRTSGSTATRSRPFRSMRPSPCTWDADGAPRRATHA